MSVEVTAETGPSQKSVHGGQSAADRRTASEKLKTKSKVSLYIFNTCCTRKLFFCDCFFFFAIVA